MRMPAVSRYMTGQPWTVERQAPLAQAHALMRDHHVRHLPVLDELGQLVGVVSERDLDRAESLCNSDPEHEPVADVMIERPFIVTSDTALDEVLDIMSEHKYGSAIVVGRGGVEGIFTAGDACQVLAELLRHDSEP